MPKFEYGMFDPEAEIESPFANGSYPDVTGGDQEARKQLSFPLDELKNFINDNLFDNDSFILDDLIEGDGNIEVVKEGKKYKLMLVVTPTGVTKAYVDFQDGETLQSAKDYTDTKIGEIPPLQPATDTTLGGVIASDGLNIDNEGKLSTSMYFDIQSIEMSVDEETDLMFKEEITSASSSETGFVELSFVGKKLHLKGLTAHEGTIIINGTKSFGITVK